MMKSFQDDLEFDCSGKSSMQISMLVSKQNSDLFELRILFHAYDWLNRIERICIHPMDTLIVEPHKFNVS